MKIVVCIKQVPDTSEVEFDPETNTLIRTGLPTIINPDDRWGILAALKLKKAAGEGSTVTAVSMGPPQAEMALLEALSIGCDEAYLISDRRFGGSDTLATSTILAAGLEKIGYDLVITGHQAIDGDTAQVGPQIAEHLGIPQVTYVEELWLSEDGVIAMRQFEDRYHKIRVACPCLLTTISGLDQPEYMTVSGVVATKEKEITRLDYEALKEHLDPAAIGLKGSPTNVVKSYTKEQKSQGKLLKDITPDQAVNAIMAMLKESHIV